MFTPSELLLGYPRISRDNLHSTRISLDIPGYPWSPFRLVKSGDVHPRLSQVNLGWTSPELFMSCPKDELHQWYLKLSQVVLCYFDLSHIVIGICWDNRYLQKLASRLFGRALQIDWPLLWRIPPWSPSVPSMRPTSMRCTSTVRRMQS